MAVPGISPPLFEGGDLLVDGAVLDNLPIGVMRERCNGTVIAVDVSPVEDVQCDPTFAMCPPSWQILRNRMNPFARAKWKVPTIFEVLSRCASLSSVQQVEQLKQRADLYLHPPVDTFSMFDWHRIVELADAGYGYTVEKLAEWAIARAGAAKTPAVPPPEATGPAPLISGVRG
jgi:predicted acylesterase/phospholipase RssA